MTAHDFISDLRACGQQDLNVIFQYLADRLYQAQLANGTMIRDITDCRAWLEELSQAARERKKVCRLESICPDCGHLHAGDPECGMPMGGERKCMCDRRVSA